MIAHLAKTIKNEMVLFIAIDENTDFHEDIQVADKKEALKICKDKKIKKSKRYNF